LSHHRRWGLPSSLSICQWQSLSEFLQRSEGRVLCHLIHIASKSLNDCHKSSIRRTFLSVIRLCLSTRVLLLLLFASQ
jgi:hypothetical protein